MRLTLPAALVAAVCALSSACADVDDAPAMPANVALADTAWSVTAVTGRMGDRTVTAGRLSLSGDGTWRLRYDYRVEGAPAEHVWSSGLSGRWRVEGGDPLAVRFDVLDDRSSAVGLVSPRGVMELTLARVALRLQRTPE